MMAVEVIMKEDGKSRKTTGDGIVGGMSRITKLGAGFAAAFHSVMKYGRDGA